MLAEASALYWRLKCDVGGGNGPNLGQVHGIGCHLSPSMVITALHVFEPQYEWPAVVASDGIWQCAVVKIWAKEDLAIVKKIKNLKGTDIPQVSGGAPLSSEQPQLGQTVGYLGRLDLGHESGAIRHVTYLSQAQVSFFNCSGDAVWVGLTGGLVQRGFSGGPVFSRSGTLIGVMSKVMQVAADLEIKQLHSLPLFSPLGSIHNELAALLPPI